MVLIDQMLSQYPKDGPSFLLPPEDRGGSYQDQPHNPKHGRVPDLQECLLHPYPVPRPFQSRGGRHLIKRDRPCSCHRSQLL